MVVVPGVLISNVANYTVHSPTMIASRTLGIGIEGTTGTIYRIESQNVLGEGPWFPVSTHSINSNGFNPLFPLPATTQQFYRALWLP